MCCEEIANDVYVASSLHPPSLQPLLANNVEEGDAVESGVAKNAKFTVPSQEPDDVIFFGIRGFFSESFGATSNCCIDPSF